MEPVECLECTLITDLTTAVNNNHEALILELQNQQTELQSSLTTLYAINYALFITICLLTLNTVLHHFFEKKY